MEYAIMDLHNFQSRVALSSVLHPIARSLIIPSLFSPSTFDKEQVTFKQLLPQNWYFEGRTPERMLSKYLQSWFLAQSQSISNLHLLITCISYCLSRPSWLQSHTVTLYAEWLLGLLMGGTNRIKIVFFSYIKHSHMDTSSCNNGNRLLLICNG